MFNAISPLDGRYADRLDVLRDYFSEFALMRMRVITEIRFIRALDEMRCFSLLTPEEIRRLEKIETDFGEKEYKEVKTIEKEINHDVKACEIFLQKNAGLRQPNRIHFGLTSEDVNNLSWTFLLKNYRDTCQLPQLRNLLFTLCDLSETWADTVFPARTHGQMASPTTYGKETAVFLNRLFTQYKKLKNLTFRGKLNGATGNYSAFRAACPNADWPAFSRRFMERYGLEINPLTTQIEDHDTWAEFFDITRRINQIIRDLDQDTWLYLMQGYLLLSLKEGEVGSSTMPHKVNPINFENSEGNLKISNALLSALSENLTTSRLQRDLSDSTVARNMGVALGHAFLAVSETLQGLSKIRVNVRNVLDEVSKHPELLAEPIQTILRKSGVPDPYGMMKNLTRGKLITLESLHQALDTLNVDPVLIRELKTLRPETYIGLAPQLALSMTADVRKYLREES
ncbi:MAG: adenylosuccinate lyase [Candidatus Marinimicrobia bacterium]|nr:adenylosuccinate lyase [Candidatus Neomarinimicrobiota bacterium]